MNPDRISLVCTPVRHATNPRRPDRSRPGRPAIHPQVQALQSALAPRSRISRRPRCPAARVIGARPPVIDFAVFRIDVTHRLIHRLELQITQRLAAFIKSLEKEPLHPLDNPQEPDSPRIRRREQHFRAPGGHRSEAWGELLSRSRRIVTDCLPCGPSAVPGSSRIVRGPPGRGEGRSDPGADSGPHR